MGDYAKTAPMETFTDSKNDRHPTDMAMLQGARMVFAQETESGRAWAESKIKSLTGGDPISARFMRQDFFTFTPKFKLLISGNHMPQLKNVDEAMRRRLYLLPFTQTFKGQNRDPHLAETLKHEFEGILQWVLKWRNGLRRSRSSTTGSGSRSHEGLLRGRGHLRTMAVRVLFARR